MEKIKNIALFLFLAVFVASLFFNVNHYVGGTAEPYRDTIRTTFVDTIPYYKPAPKDSAVIRHVTQRLPVVDVNEVNFAKRGNNDEQNIPQSDNNVSENIPDSADVVIPITQKVYEDSAYTAWVSGYKPSLDSLILYPQREVVTIIEREKPKRWHIGPGIGFGITPNGCDSYIGINIIYSIFSF